MRILLDNCLPVGLAPHIRGHEVRTAVQMGWGGLDDGALLDAMAGSFDVLLTADRNMRFQQTFAGRPFAVVVLKACVNRVGELARLVPSLWKVLKDIVPGDV